MAFHSVLAFTFYLFLLPLSATASAPTTAIPLRVNDIISATISAGNFHNWAHLLSSNPTLLPPNFTLFLPLSAPTNTTLISFNNSTFDKKTQEKFRSYFLLLYHIVPHRLSFSELVQFPIHTRLPTLLPGYSLVITANHHNDSVSCNFAIDGSCITRPDLYQGDSAIAHGVGFALNYTVYSDETNTLPIDEIRPFSWTTPSRPFLILPTAGAWFFFIVVFLLPFLLPGDDNDVDDEGNDNDDDEGNDNDDDDDYGYDDLISDLDHLVLECMEVRERAMEMIQDCIQEREEFERRRKAREEEFQRAVQLFRLRYGVEYDDDDIEMQDLYD